MNKFKIENLRSGSKIHMIGIGGISMSALADILIYFGYEVSGSDVVKSPLTEKLVAKGATIYIGQSDENIKSPDLVCYTAAVKEDNPEYMRAKELGIPTIERAELLGIMMTNYDLPLAVAGTHGKTTTSSLITHLMITGGMKPSAIVGGVMNNYETNSVLGDSDWIVAEADESDGSFLRLNKMVSVVTSMDPEHLDYYGSVEQMNLAYRHFLQTTSFYGFCVVCTDHPVVKETIKEIKYRKIISYGLKDDADVQAININVKSGELKFDIKVQDKTYTDFILPMFGYHNILNALAAFAVVYYNGMNVDKIRQGLASFAGVQRRFTKRGSVNGINIYDDYGHHPEEIKATLKAAKEATPNNKVIAVFQPHRYSRFSDLMNEFIQSFDNADILLVADVYGAGEKPIENVNKEIFIEKMRRNNVFAVNNAQQMNETIATIAKSGDLVIGLGAGDISKWMTNLPNYLQERKS